MRRYKLIIGTLLGFMMVFATPLKSFALDFDAELIYESIFVIYSGNYEGSGFAIGSNIIITSLHVIGDRNDISVKTYSGEEYEASILLTNEDIDIAIISITNAEFIPLDVGDCNNIKVGEDIYAIGAPRNLEYTLTKGVISNKSRTIGDINYIQIDAAINSGNSGGPLLNSAGQVIGVNAMKVSDAEGIGLAIPISYVMSFIEGNDLSQAEEDTGNNQVEFASDTESDNENRENIVIVKETNYTLAIILGVILALSLLTNIILVIVLVYKSNKDVIVPTDLRDRTDFDIDVWE